MAIEQLRCPSPPRDLATPVATADIRAQVDEMLRLGRAEKAALKQEVSEWEWCRKRLVGNGARGCQPYTQWWGLFNSTLAIGKRAVNEDVRTIHRQAPATKSVSREVTTAPPRKEWLVVGKNVEVKWDSDWWQAKIKKVKVDKATDRIDKVYVSYVGGTADEDEWIPYSSKRIRPPTIGFSDTTSGI